jgi:hypothetical protein
MPFLKTARVILKNWMIIALAMTSVACGRQSSGILNLGEFAPYADRFQQAAAQQGLQVPVDNLIIRFGELQNERQNGLCELTSDQTPTITIRKEIWDQMDDADREELIFHEMGHCVLGRSHKSEKSADGVPLSIMHPYRISNSVYLEYRDQYLTELFNPNITPDNDDNGSSNNNGNGNNNGNAYGRNK